MTTEITAYEAEYFLVTVRRVLDPLLAKYGFHYVGAHRNVTAYWMAAGLFLRVGYLPETLPNYELLIGVGASEDSPLAPKSSSNSVGVWRLCPADIAPMIVDWRFDSACTLKDALRRAWSDAILPYVIPLLHDRCRLDELIADHEDELSAADENVMRDRLLAHARTQFEAGRFPEAVAAYHEAGEEVMTRADRKRLEIARSRL